MVVCFTYSARKPKVARCCFFCTFSLVRICRIGERTGWKFEFQIVRKFMFFPARYEGRGGEGRVPHVCVYKQDSRGREREDRIFSHVRNRRSNSPPPPPSFQAADYRSGVGSMGGWVSGCVVYTLTLHTCTYVRTMIL